METFKICKTEIKKLITNKYYIMAILAIIIVPMLYSLLYLAAFWDPYEKLSELPVAVVNKDVGDNDKYQGEETLGNRLVKKLSENNNVKWIITDEKDASQGLENNKYYSVFTIPKDFTVNTLSGNTEKQIKPNLIYSNNEKKNFLAAQINSKVELELKDKIEKEITKEYLKTSFDSILELKTGMEKLSDGTEQLKTGTDKFLTASTKLKNGGEKLSSSTNTLKEGINTLEDKTKVFTEKNQELNLGLNIFSNMFEKFSNSFNLYNQKIGEFSKGTEKLFNGSKAIDNGMEKLVLGTNKLTAGSENLKQSSDKLNGGLKQLRDTYNEEIVPQMAILSNSSKQLKGIINSNIAETQEKEVENSLTKIILNNVNILKQEQKVLTNISGIGVNSKKIDSELKTLILNHPELKNDPNIKNIIKNNNGNLKTLNDSQKDMQKIQKDLQSNSANILELKTNINEQKIMQSELKIGINKILGGNILLNEKMNTTSNSFKKGLEQIYLGETKINNGVSTLNTGIKELDKNVNKLNLGNKEISKGTENIFEASKLLSLNAEKFNNAILKLEDGEQKIVSGSNKLTDGSKLLVNGVSKLSQGTDKLSNATNIFADKLKEFVNGTSTLNKGADTLNSKVSEGIQKIDDSVKVSSKEYAEFGSEPLEIKEEKTHEVPNYGTGFSPYFIPLSLWVGGIMMFFVVEPFFKNKEMSKFKKVIGKYSAYAFIGVLQALLVSGAVLSLGLKPQNTTLFVTFNILMSFVFIAIIQMLITLLGDIGRIISIILLILQLTACGGTFPLELIPSLFKNLNPYMPFTYGVEGLREISSGLNMQVLQKDMLILTIIGITSLLILTILINKGEKINIYLKNKKNSAINE